MKRKLPSVCSVQVSLCKMYRAILEQIKPFLHFHYFSNLLLALLFLMLKFIPWTCVVLFDDCHLELREYELLTFLGCVLVVKGRKQASSQDYFSTVCMFAKILNTILFFRQNPLLAVVYIIISILHLAMLPEPAYSGPEAITYFTGDQLEEELDRDKRITWIVEFYAAWSPLCVSFAKIFSALSGKYSLDNLKFGKVDVTRSPKVVEKLKINVSPWSKSLPTVIVFQNGKEKDRRPFTDIKGRTIRFVFSEANIIREFQLNELHHQCKQNPLPSKRQKEEKKEQ